VPAADVVITNPTRLAVALKFDADDMDAPMVVAKGAGEIARKIREIAREHNVPLVEEKPLARALYKTVEIDQSIPVELYRAVAEVLAYVYRLKGKLPSPATQA
jgi:flagellar biosynthetic protein FlhB